MTRSSEHDDFVPWYRRDTAGWLRLSLAARGAMAEIVRKLNRNGELRLSGGLADLAVILRLEWAGELEPAVAELIAAGRVEWDGSRYTLRDPEFDARKRKSSTERVKEHRERKRRETEAGCNAGNVSSVTPVTPVTGNACNAETPSLSILSDLSLSSVSSRSDLPGRSEGVAAGGAPPPWFAEAVEIVRMNAGLEVDDVPARWLEYTSARTRKGWPMGAQDAAGWLSSVLRSERARRSDGPRRGAALVQSGEDRCWDVPEALK